MATMQVAERATEKGSPYITLEQAAEVFAEVFPCRRPCPATVSKLHRIGINGVRLKVVSGANSRQKFSTREWVLEFIRQVNGSVDGFTEAISRTLEKV